MHPAITESRDALTALCRKHHVASLDVFGSAATDAYRDDSDFDFLVTFKPGLEPIPYKNAYFGLLEGLEELLGTHIDLVTERSIQNPYFHEGVESSRSPIYAAA